MQIGEYNVKFVHRDLIKVGCTPVRRDQILAILKRMDKQKAPRFALGDYVKIVGKSGDDAEVTGMIGRVVRVDGSNGDGLDILCYFPGWHGGHDGDGSKGNYADSFYYVSYRGCKKVPKPEGMKS